ncbi:cysteine hydrolase family protein [Salinicoccus siamensis]|uniref:Cysteine hydrolase family protein n=1 Tax=Salinicoccus siamensis TaxID=381830 RepID=A0ABV5Z0L8_9STAP
MEGKTALIMIDIINKMDFEGSENLLENARGIIEPLRELKRQAKENDIPVIYANDNFGLWHEDMNSLIEECKKGIGKEVIEQLLPEEKDYFLIKPKHSAFFGTQLDILLRKLEVENLILTGLSGDMCVLFTSSEAYMREFNLWVPGDCVASEVDEDHEASLRIINRSMFANVTPATETDIIEAF